MISSPAAKLCQGSFSSTSFPSSYPPVSVIFPMCPKSLILLLVETQRRLFSTFFGIRITLLSSKLPPVFQQSQWLLIFSLYGSVTKNSVLVIKHLLRGQPSVRPSHLPSQTSHISYLALSAGVEGRMASTGQVNGTTTRTVDLFPTSNSSKPLSSSKKMQPYLHFS